VWYLDELQASKDYICAIIIIIIISLACCYEAVSLETRVLKLNCHFVFPNVELFLVLQRLYFCVLTAAYYVTFSVHENVFTGFILESVILFILLWNYPSTYINFVDHLYLI
jgi:hypothetical protein